MALHGKVLRPKWPTWLQFHVLRTYRRAAWWKRRPESECQQGFCAAIPAPCPKMPPEPCKKRVRNPPKPSPARPQTVQNRGPGRPWEPKCIQKAPQTSQETSRSAQEAPKRRPRGTKSWPRVAQSRPSDAQEAPKSAPDPSKMEPDEPQDEFLARSLWEALFDRLLERFCVVVCLVRNKRDVLTT